MRSILDLSAAGWDRHRRWIALVWIVQIVLAAYFSLLPAAKLGAMPGSDKAWHFGSYLILALPIPFLWNGKTRLYTAAVLLALYGAGLEVAQQYVPGRSFELADMLANSTGVACGAALAAWLRSVFFAFRWNAVPDSNSTR